MDEHLGNGVIVLPARDEGPRVGGIVQRVRSVVPGIPVLVVANGCTDDTVDRAQRAGARVIESPAGYARALRTGYRHVVDGWDRGSEGPWLVQLDADGQHPPESIPELLAELKRADLVIGSRFVGSAHDREATPWTRRWGIQALALWTSLLIHQRVRDVTSGFMALSPALVRVLAGSFPEEVADANVLVRVQRSGFRIAEVPVTMAPRSGGRGMHGGWRSGVHGARVMALATWEARRGLG